MIRFFTLLALALVALAIVIDSTVFWGSALVVVGLTTAGLAISLCAELSRDT